MAYTIPKVELLPLTDDRVAFNVAGVERMVWNFAKRYPRPHLYPVIGPSGKPLTRMGHPDAPDHDHHRSIWFAHHDVGGVGFWADRPVPTQQIRQEQWLAYQDGDDEALAAVRLGWFDPHAVKLMQQDLLIVLRPLPAGESWIELQSVFTTQLDPLVLGKTNFGFLAVRVAKSICARFGGGRLRSSEGAVGEPAIFAKPAKWMDYSGPIVGDKWEGITYFDHPSNPHQPTHWHVREDGWMSAAFCLNQAYSLRKDAPLTLRYGLHLHAGDVDPKAADERLKQFAGSAPYAPEPAKPYRMVFRRKG